MPSPSLAPRDRRPAAPASRRDAPRWVAWVLLLRRNAAALVVLFLLSVGATYGLVRLLPETFRATSSIIVDPAIDPADEGAGDTLGILSIPTLQNLLRQHATLDAVRRVVRLARGDLATSADALAASALADLAPEDRATLAAAPDDLLEGISLEDFANRFEARPTIEKKLAFDVVYSPVIYLDALADSPELARALANAWVNVFTVLFEDLKTRQLEENRRAVEAEYTRARTAWEATLAAIRDVNSEAQLSVVEARHQETVASYGTVFARLMEAEREREVARRQLEDLAARLAILTDDRNEWIGKVDTRLMLAVEDDATTDTLLLALRTPVLDPADSRGAAYEAMRQRALLSRLELRNSARALLEFERRNPLDELNLRKADATARLNEALRRRRQLSVEIPAMDAAIRSAEGLLDATSATLALRQVLPVEVLAELLAAGEPGRALPPDAAVTYTSEAMDPGWQKLVEDLTGVRMAYFRMQPEVALYDELIEDVITEIARLQEDISSFAVQQAILSKAHDAVHASNDDLYRRYTALQVEEHETAARVASLDTEIERLTARLEVLLGQSRSDYARIQETTNRVAVFEARASQEKSLTDSLQQQLEQIQIRLSEDAREIKIATLAVTPEEKIFPPRTAISLGAGLVVLIGLVLLLVVREEFFAAGAGDEARG